MDEGMQELGQTLNEDMESSGEPGDPDGNENVRARASIMPAIGDVINDASWNYLIC